MSNEFDEARGSRTLMCSTLSADCAKLCILACYKGQRKGRNETRSFMELSSKHHGYLVLGTYAVRNLLIHSTDVYTPRHLWLARETMRFSLLNRSSTDTCFSPQVSNIERHAGQIYEITQEYARIAAYLPGDYRLNRFVIYTVISHAMLPLRRMIRVTKAEISVSLSMSKRQVSTSWRQPNYVRFTFVQVMTLRLAWEGCTWKSKPQILKFGVEFAPSPHSPSIPFRSGGLIYQLTLKPNEVFKLRQQHNSTRKTMDRKQK
ncbi:hypothetical protein KCU67_g7, partial [Aureobasidium melanogenum]